MNIVRTIVDVTFCIILFGVVLPLSVVALWKANHDR
jgi:hypothetical protein